MKILTLLFFLVISTNSFSQYYSKKSKDELIRELFDEYNPRYNYILNNLGDFNYLHYLKGANTESEIILAIEVLIHESTHALSAKDNFIKTRELAGNNEIVSFNKIAPVNNIFMKAVVTSSGGIYLGNVDRNNLPSAFTNIYITDSISILMRKTDHFCENSINDIVPEDIRDKIYRIVYTQNCSKRGIYSYVNEFSAYYNGCKSTIDLSDYIFKKAVETNDVNYLLSLMRTLSTLDAYYEMKLFIAWSLIYAKQNEPDIYELLYANNNLRVTYTIIDTLFSKLVDDCQPLIVKVNEMIKNKFYEEIEILNHQFTFKALGPLKYIFDLPATKSNYLKGLFTEDIVKELKRFSLDSCGLENYETFLNDPFEQIIIEEGLKVIADNQGAEIYNDENIAELNEIDLSETAPVIFKNYPDFSQFDKTKTQKKCIDILEKYSPDCYSMVYDYYTLPREFICHGTHWYFEKPIKINDLVEKKDLIASLPWAIFSLCHKYSNLKGNIIKAGNNDCGGIEKGVYNYNINPLENITVSHTDVILTRKIAKQMTKQARGQYFHSAILSKDTELATQKYGIYGLLMEYNSFYYAMRLTIDMLDLYKEEIGYNQQEWLKFFGRSEMIYSTYIEYKLYMMEYLRIVKNNYPSIYEQIITNVQFKKAFFEIDVNWMIALKEYDLFKKQIFSYLENNGLSVKETNKSIQIQNMAINNSKLQLDRMNKYLDSDIFNEIFNDLNYKEKARHY